MLLCITIPLLVIFVPLSSGWKAVPANQASYALRQDRDDDEDEDDAGSFAEGVELLPRHSLHSVYKFGYCKHEFVKPVYLRKNVSLHFMNYFESRVKYIYLIDFKHTQRNAQQCVVMKLYVPKMYLFRRSRLPMYYCQGQAHYLILNTIQKLQVHEFYIGTDFLLPADIKFEFYWPAPYHSTIPPDL